jgi:hypothetical protein
MTASSDVELSADRVRRLALWQPGTPVLSVYVRTDPRDPANTSATPRWGIELRNALRDVRTGSHDADRTSHDLAAQLFDRAERDIFALAPSERARGLAWFGAGDMPAERFTLQLPPRETSAHLDSRACISPLVEVADHGRPAGLVLLSTDAVRLLHWQGGRVSEPERPVYEFEPGQWRDYAAYVGHAAPARGATHVGTFDQRVDEWRDRFVADAARAVATVLDDLGWPRMVLAGETRVLEAFRAALPPNLGDRVVATFEANLMWDEPAAVADRLEPLLEQAWERAAQSFIEQVTQSAASGGPAALGWSEVADCLLQGRVAHVAFAADASPDPAVLAPHLLAGLGEVKPGMLVERLVEVAVSTGAGITAVPAATAPKALARAGGVVARLRY